MNKEINKIEDNSETSSAKWMPSKMRMMRKMITSERTGLDTPLNPMQKYFEDQKQPKPPNNSENDNMSRNNSLNSSSNTAIRACSDCNTTKTPLWRSGPRGPKVYRFFNAYLKDHVEIVGISCVPYMLSL